MSVQRTNDTSGQPTIARRGEKQSPKPTTAPKQADTSRLTSGHDERGIKVSPPNGLTEEFKADFKKWLLPCGALIVLFYAIGASGVLGPIGFIVMDMLSTILFFALAAYVIFYKKRINVHSRPDGYTQVRRSKNKKANS